jgi:anti-sigma factor ChrR (cupin superfamily)
MNFLNPQLVKSALEQAKDGKIFTVAFQKQDGSLRIMNCRRGVKKHLHGGKSTIAANPNLIGVFDTQKGEYRCFDTTRTISIKSRGAVIAAA